LIVFSHIEIGNYLFHAVTKKKDDAFKLNWGAFVFGNVFPDISKFASRNHFYEDTKSIYKCYLMKAGNPQRSDRERSMALGVVCHFLCDYFCKYHAKLPYTRQSMIRHLWYEFILHMKIVDILFRKSIGFLRSNEFSVFESEAGKNAGKNAVEGSFDLPGMLHKYEEDEESELTDMAFSFEAVRIVMKEILGSETAVSDIKNRAGRTPACSVAA